MSSESGGEGKCGSGLSPRYEWYQTESDVVVIIRAKGANVESAQVTFEPRSLSVIAAKDDGVGRYELKLALSREIVPKDSSFKVSKVRSKIEMRMRKAVGGQWNVLEASREPPPQERPSSNEIPATDETQKIAKSYPTSSLRGPKDWDKLEKEVKTEEEKEQLEGDAAVNKLFQKIYADSSDEVRRAMMKSFIESKGTVLSTNWDEVGRAPVEAKPPEGLEWKNW
ncbi:unnamed protein product [Soboliphyme baturini]|uniref:SGT1 n=1 Tax=Soboliphyme baturini TaxID=241478 RepID=A0A183IJY7_9BILA|nr:unnamed protein product [Soboliphyme baturini]